MKMEEIRRIAEERGILPGRVRKADLIRTIQKSEGNAECFGSGRANECGQTGCLWRKDCH